MKEAKPDKALLTYRDLHELTGFPMGTLYAMVSQKRIPHVRLSARMVVFEESEIRAWLASHRVEAAE